MLREISILAAMLTCAACQYPPEDAQVAAVPGQPEPLCHDFTTPVTAGGRPEQARGQACEQPDGSWQVVQYTPGLPTQTYVLEPPGQPAPEALAQGARGAMHLSQCFVTEFTCLVFADGPEPHAVAATHNQTSRM